MQERNHCSWAQQSINLIKKFDEGNKYAEIYEGFWAEDEKGTPKHLAEYEDGTDDISNDPYDIRYKKYHPIIVGAFWEDQVTTPKIWNAPYSAGLRDYNHYGYAEDGLEWNDWFITDYERAGTPQPPLPSKRFFSAKNWGFGGNKLFEGKVKVENFNKFTFAQAIREYNEHYITGKKLAYLMLGYVLHLLQDSGNPDHANLEPHVASGKNLWEAHEKLYLCYVKAAISAGFSVTPQRALDLYKNTGNAKALAIVEGVWRFIFGPLAWKNFAINLPIAASKLSDCGLKCLNVGGRIVGYERLLGDIWRFDGSHWKQNPEYYNSFLKKKEMLKPIDKINDIDLNYEDFFKNLAEKDINLANSYDLKPRHPLGLNYVQTNPPIAIEPAIYLDPDLSHAIEWKNEFLRFSDEIALNIIAHGAGFIKYFYNIVNSPPYVYRVVLVKSVPGNEPIGFAKLDNPRGKIIYNAVWKRSPYQDTKDNFQFKVSSSHETHVFIIFGPSVGPYGYDKVDKGRRVVVPSANLIGSPEKSPIEIKLEEIDNDPSIGKYYYGKVTALNKSEKIHNLTLEISARDYYPHLGIRDYATRGHDLHTDPVTLPKVDVENPPKYPLIGYRPGKDTNNRFLLAPPILPDKYQHHTFETATSLDLISRKIVPISPAGNEKFLYLSVAGGESILAFDPSSSSKADILRSIEGEIGRNLLKNAVIAEMGVDNLASSIMERSSVLGILREVSPELEGKTAIAAAKSQLGSDKFFDTVLQLSDNAKVANVVVPMMSSDAIITGARTMLGETEYTDTILQLADSAKAANAIVPLLKSDAILELALVQLGDQKVADIALQTTDKKQVATKLASMLNSNDIITSARVQVGDLKVADMALQATDKKQVATKLASMLNSSDIITSARVQVGDLKVADMALQATDKKQVATKLASMLNSNDIVTSARVQVGDQRVADIALQTSDKKQVATKLASMLKSNEIVAIARVQVGDQRVADIALQTSDKKQVATKLASMLNSNDIVAIARVQVGDQRVADIALQTANKEQVATKLVSMLNSNDIVAIARVQVGDQRVADIALQTADKKQVAMKLAEKMVHSDIIAVAQSNLSAADYATFVLKIADSTQVPKAAVPLMNDDAIVTSAKTKPNKASFAERVLKKADGTQVAKAVISLMSSDVIITSAKTTLKAADYATAVLQVADSTQVAKAVIPLMSSDVIITSAKTTLKPADYVTAVLQVADSIQVAKAVIPLMSSDVIITSAKTTLKAADYVTAVLQVADSTQVAKAVISLIKSNEIVKTARIQLGDKMLADIALRNSDKAQVAAKLVSKMNSNDIVTSARVQLGDEKITNLLLQQADIANVSARLEPMLEREEIIIAAKTSLGAELNDILIQSVNNNQLLELGVSKLGEDKIFDHVLAGCEAEGTILKGPGVIKSGFDIETGSSIEISGLTLIGKESDFFLVEYMPNGKDLSWSSEEGGKVELGGGMGYFEIVPPYIRIVLEEEFNADISFVIYDSKRKIKFTEIRNDSVVASPHLMFADNRFYIEIKNPDLENQGSLRYRLKVSYTNSGKRFKVRRPLVDIDRIKRILFGKLGMEPDVEKWRKSVMVNSDATEIVYFDDKLLTNDLETVVREIVAEMKLDKMEMHQKEDELNNKINQVILHAP